MDAEHEASQALMRNGERMSGHGSSAVDGFQLSVDGGSSSEDGAQLIPDPHQPAQVVTSMDDGILLHPDTDDFPEDDIYMEDDTYMEDEDGSWDDDSSSGEYGKLPGAPWHLWQVVRDVWLCHLCLGGANVM